MQDPVPTAAPAPARVPAQRAADGATEVTSADVLRSLGLEALVSLVESTAYGVCITGDDHTWVYLNPAGAELIGRPFEQVRGTDYLLSFPEHERAALLALEAEQRSGDAGFYTNTVVRPDGSRREMTWSGTVLQVGGAELAPAVFHDTTGVDGARREAAALATASAALTAGGSLADVLGALAAALVEATRACRCLVLVAGADGCLELAATSGPDPDAAGAARLAAARLRLDDLPGAVELRAGRRVPLAPAGPPALAAALAAVDQGVVLVPVRWQGDVAGCLAVVLPPDVTSLEESELALCSALGDSAAVALAGDRLQQQVADASARSERARLARDLHDSVTHALFAVHQRAQLLERALDRGDDALLRAAAQDLRPLAEQALEGMRRLVTERRGEATGIGAALADLVATVERRDGLRVRLDVQPDLPPCPGPLTEHLVHIAAEALHNAVKHSGARSAEVELALGGSELVLRVSDAGRGFDRSAVVEGHGQRTLRERAALCGGWVRVDSAPGSGTTVTARVPLPG